MAALLVAMSIMAIMMTVAMPVWKQTAQREKEEELVFRGKQYVHAIGLFQRKFANAYPPNIDVLVEQRFLRKKFKDPITNDDFVPIPAGQAVPGRAAAGGQRGRRGGPTAPADAGRRRRRRAAAPSRRTAQPAAGRGRGRRSDAGRRSAVGGISGVTSKSKDQSIRLYNGRGHYNEWAFVYIQQQQAPGAGALRVGDAGSRRPARSARSAPAAPSAAAASAGRGVGPDGPGGPNGPGRGSGGLGTFGGGGVDADPAAVRRRAAASEVRTSRAVRWPSRARVFLVQSRLRAIANGRERGDDEQPDADRGAAQQHLADAEQRRVDQHAAEQRVQQLARRATPTPAGRPTAAAIGAQPRPVRAHAAIERLQRRLRLRRRHPRHRQPRDRRQRRR